MQSHGLTGGNRINDILEIAFLIRRNAHVSPLGKDEPIRRDSGRLLPYCNIDPSPTGTDGSQGLVESGLYACGIERYVHARAVAQLADLRDYIVFGGIEHVVGAELFREFLPSGRDFGDYDLFGTFGHERLDYREPDGPTAEDEDRVAFFEWTDFHGVPCHSQRFYECWVR